MLVGWESQKSKATKVSRTRLGGNTISFRPIKKASELAFEM
jgi:hypothetical protein